MAKKLTKLSDLQPAPYNPREISDEALGGLKASLARFGDISGLVWNSRTGHLVAGHQRLRALQEQHGEGLRFDGGCVVAPDGERFAVRVVDWDETTEKAANIAANSQYLAGAFTADLQGMLGGLMQEFPDFSALRLDSLLDGAFDVSPIDAPVLQSQDKKPFQQMTFTLHDSQAEKVTQAIEKAKSSGNGESDVNTNSNGNALAFICEGFCD